MCCSKGFKILVKTLKEDDDRGRGWNWMANRYKISRALIVALVNPEAFLVKPNEKIPLVKEVLDNGGTKDDCIRYLPGISKKEILGIIRKLKKDKEENMAASIKASKVISEEEKDKRVKILLAKQSIEFSSSEEDKEEVPEAIEQNETPVENVVVSEPVMDFEPEEPDVMPKKEVTVVKVSPKKFTLIDLLGSVDGQKLYVDYRKIALGLDIVSGLMKRSISIDEIVGLNKEVAE